MKVFMLGWEFPPFISGGLGTACYGLTKAMSDMGVQVVFVLPRPVDSSYATHVRMLTPQHDMGDPTQVQVKEEHLKNVKFHTIDSPLQPYGDPKQYQQQVDEVLRKKRSFPTLQAALLQRSESAVEEAIAGAHYAGDMLSEVHRYASAAVRLAMQEDFDVIHAHDWMTYPAGIAVAAVTGKPLVVHVHSTEFDRSGEHVNQLIYDIERRGMHAADKIIAVSHLTRNIILSRYGILGEKVEVVYNGVERNGDALPVHPVGHQQRRKDRPVPGPHHHAERPEYFLMAARRSSKRSRMSNLSWPAPAT